MSVIDRGRFATGANNLCRPMSPRTRVCHCKPLIGLNRRGRSESSWGALGPSPVRGLCQHRVLLVGAAGLRGHCDVRFTSDSDRAGALHWSKAMGESRTRSTVTNEVDGPMTSLEVQQRRWGGAAKRLGGGQIAQGLRCVPAAGTIALFQASSVRQERRQRRCQNRCPSFHRRSACATAFPKAHTTAASRRHRSEPLVRPIFRSLHPPKGPASYRHRTCKAEDNNTMHGSVDRILPERGSARVAERYCTL